MPKLTKLQRSAIERALHHAERALKYIRQDHIAVGHLGNFASTTTHFVRASDRKTFYPMDKEIGSDLCGLEMARDELRNLLP